jgi:hypothetical protein
MQENVSFKHQQTGNVSACYVCARVRAHVYVCAQSQENISRFSFLPGTQTRSPNVGTCPTQHLRRARCSFLT